MTDIFDRAAELEEYTSAAALQEQQRRAGLAGKCPADSAATCGECGDAIPLKRRKAVPGCKYCTVCQTLREKAFYER